MACDPENGAPWLVIGLGNPGADYEETYHNVGFRVVEILARRRGLAFALRVGSARMARFSDGAEIALVQPLTYMNRSGTVLAGLFEKFGHDACMLVVSDDLALPVGKIRVRERGSAGGHNGLKSIASVYGSDDYVRVRVGIAADRPVETARDYVLSRIEKAHRETLERAETLAADAVEHIIEAGTRSAMSKFNGLDLCEKGDEE